MLKFTYLYEDYDLAASALSLWLDAGAREALDWFRISANAIYAARDPKFGQRFLRMAPESEKRPDTLQAEADFIDYLADKGYPAARMLPSLRGAKVETLSYKGETWYASYFEGARGERSDRIEWTDEIAFRYGEALGKMHNLSREYPPDGRCRSYADVLLSAMEIFRQNGKEEALRATDTLITALDKMPKTKENFGLLHYDFEPDNVFFDGGKPSVIDFESGLTFFYAADVVIACNALDDAVPEEKIDWAAARVLEGYESVSPLDRELLRRWELQAFYDARGLADILRCLSDPPIVNEPEWATELRGKLSEYARVRENRLIAAARKGMGA